MGFDKCALWGVGPHVCNRLNPNPSHTLKKHLNERQVETPYQVEP